MAKIIATGLTTITRLEESIRVSLTNKICAISCYSDGTPRLGAFNNAYTYVELFRGRDKVPFYEVEIGELQTTGGVKAKKISNRIVVTDMTEESGVVSFPVSRRGKLLGVQTLNIVKQLDGLESSAVRIVGEQVFKYNDSGEVNTDFIYLSAVTQNLKNAKFKWYYKNNKGTYVSIGENHYGASIKDSKDRRLIDSTGKTLLTSMGTIGIPHEDAEMWGDRTVLTLKCEVSGFIYDEFTIAKVKDGSRAYTVVLSNESHSFSSNNEGYINKDKLEKCEVNCYKGSEKIKPVSITQKSSTPPGMRISINSPIINITASKGSSLKKEGVMRFKIEPEKGVFIEKCFTWTKVQDGKGGQDGVNGVDGQPGKDGEEGRGYTLVVEGGTRGYSYSAIGDNPRPTKSEKFTVKTFMNNKEIVPKSIYWSSIGNLSGTSNKKDFVPTVSRNYKDSVYTVVKVAVNVNGVGLSQTIPVVCNKHAGGLDWIEDWNTNAVYIGEQKIISPKIFSGRKESDGSITGVALGRDVFNHTGVTKRTGLVGYKKSVPVFSLSDQADFFLSSKGSSESVLNGSANGMYFDGNNLHVTGNIHLRGSSKIGDFTVEQTEDALNGINDLEIGGKNLVLESSKFKAGACAKELSSCVEKDGVLKVVAKKSNGNWFASWFTSLKDLESKLAEGDKFTVSFTMKSPNSTKAPNIYLKSGMGYYGLKGKLGKDYSTVYYTGNWKKSNPISPHLGFSGLEGTFYIKNWKIEKGNKPTDWTPAPEDTDAELDKRPTRENIIPSINIDGSNLKIRASKLDLTGLVTVNDLKGKGTTTIDGSNIKTGTISAERIDIRHKYDILNSVNGTYLTKSQFYVDKNGFKQELEGYKKNINGSISNLSSKIESSVAGIKKEFKEELDNITIGGRNLIRKKDMTLSSTSGNFDEKTNTWTLTATNGAGGTFGAGLVITGKNAKIPFGRGYVLSFEIKVPVDCRWCGDVNNYPCSGSKWSGNDHDIVNKRKFSNFGLTKNKWHKCWAYFENTSSKNTNMVDIYDGSHFGIINKTGRNMTFQIRNVKGELGNKATDWTPAPEDIEDGLIQFENTVEESAKAFKRTLKVTGDTGGIVSIFEQAGNKINSVISEKNLNSKIENVVSSKPGKIATLIRKEVKNAKTFPDARSKNERPSWYLENYPQQTITEFKYRSVLGISEGGTYGTLETRVPWGDSSGGLPHQVFKVDKGGTFERHANSLSSWSKWEKTESVSGVNKKIKDLSDNVISPISKKVIEVERKVTGDSIIEMLRGTEKYISDTSIELGGVNLFENSNFANKEKNFSPWDKTSKLRWRLCDKFEDQRCFAGKNGRMVLIECLSRDDYGSILRTKVEEKGNYTISFDYICAGGITSSSSYMVLHYPKNKKYIHLPYNTKTDKKRRHYEKTFHIDAGCTIDLRVGGINKEYSWTIFDKIKLEKGNRSSDWSPAPEDLYDIMVKKENSIISTLDGTISTISNHTTSINDLKSNTVSTSNFNVLEETVSGISRTVGSNTSAIGTKLESRTFTTYKQENDRFVASVKTGGNENICSNGGFESNDTAIVKEKSRDTASAYVTEKIYEATANTGGKFFFIDTHKGDAYALTTLSFIFESEMTYTISADVRYATTGNVISPSSQIEFWGNYHPLFVENKPFGKGGYTNNWHRVSTTWTAPKCDVPGRAFLRFGLRTDKYGWSAFDNVKVEKGTVATGYTTPGNEVNGSIMTLDSEKLRCQYEDGSYSQMGRNGFEWKSGKMKYPYHCLISVIGFSSNVESSKLIYVKIPEVFKGRRYSAYAVLSDSWIDSWNHTEPWAIQRMVAYIDDDYSDFANGQLAVMAYRIDKNIKTNGKRTRGVAGQIIIVA